MSAPNPRDVVWIGSSLRDVREFPEDVRQVMGFALYEAQTGGKHPKTTPMKGFKGAGILEAAADHEGSTYRTVYTVRFQEAIYVLHAFQKKSKHGVSTPKADVDLILKRYDTAVAMHESFMSRGRGRNA